MRRRAMLSLAIAGMFIISTAAVTQANWYHKSEGSGGSTSDMMSPSEGPGTKAGTYEEQEALETGKLPPRDDSRLSSAQSFPGGEPIQVIEQGGVTYRLGIDTQ